VATNPRIEDLRKRIEKEPGSRLFAQLAEELRKDGELEDAIRVAREGLQKHPNYPSARMTLGRALLDTGDWAAARTEFELVLKSAADNILASRYLAECLENLGDRDGAIARYKSTLAMAPGEKHVLARLHELEKGTAAGAAPAAVMAAPPATGAFMRPVMGLRPGSPKPPIVVPPPAAPPPPAAAPPAAPMAAAPPPPIPLATVEGEMELETSRTLPLPRAPAAVTESADPIAPIPLVAADEEFELERPYESPTTGIGMSGAARTEAPSPTTTAAAVPSEDQEFELEAPHEVPSTGWVPSIRPLPVVEEPLPSEPPPAAAPPASPPPLASPLAAATSAPSALISPTLGELYFNQGFTDRAIEVYRELSVREPGNDRLSARLRELEKLQRALSGGEPAPAAPTPMAADTAAADRREAIERTIVRLEGLLSAIRKG
jgi:tetratricopeptide (TPR) repeat protein